MITDDYIATRVYRIEREPYVGDVCNIETTDNTYLVGNAVVHNCLEDYLDPEFLMVGYLDPLDARSSRHLIARHIVHELYEPLQLDCLRRTGRQPPLIEMGVTSAELSKVVYNVSISSRLAIINSVMELCQRIPGANIDDVSRVLEAATKRVSGSQYWRGGGGDSGSCHPRDSIAMSWLAREKGLGFDVFEAAMLAREKQAQWFVDEIVKAASQPLPDRKCRVLMLNYAYKRGSNITTGSYVLLVWRTLTSDETLMQWLQVDLRDPIVEGVPVENADLEKYDVIFIGMNHPGVADYDFPDSVVVIDPFRIVRPAQAKRLISLGIGPAIHA